MKTLLRVLHVQGSLFLQRKRKFMDLLQQSALAWKEIIEYQYLFTYGYKKQLHPISLTFSLDDIPIWPASST